MRLRTNLFYCNSSRSGTCDCYCCRAEDDASVTGAMNCLATAASVSAGSDSSDVELKGSFDATFDSGDQICSVLFFPLPL